MTEDYEDDGRPAFPLGVWIAGVIWVFFGGLGLFGAAMALVVWVLGGGGEPSCCGASCLAIIAAGFLGAGLTTVRGEVADILGCGAWSIGISLFAFTTAALVTYVELSGPPGGWNLGALLAVTGPFAGFGFLFLLAGILAVTGRRRYREWREANAPTRDAGPDDPGG